MWLPVDLRARVSASSLGFFSRFEHSPYHHSECAFLWWVRFSAFLLFWQWCRSPLPPRHSAVWLFPNIAMLFSRVNSAITPGQFQSPSCGQVQFHLFLTYVSYFRDHRVLLYISVKLCFTKTLWLFFIVPLSAAKHHSPCYMYTYIYGITHKLE